MTRSSTINISSDRVIQWMNIIRNTSGSHQYRLLENFWESQLRSKAWVINTLKSLDLSIGKDVYIFGGWYGVLGSLIKDNFLYEKIYSIDIDPICQKMGSQLDDRVSFVTNDMANFEFQDISNIGLIINTSTEHVSQKTFDTWMKKNPTNVPIVLQGNNFFECNEHVRCTKNLEEFKKINVLTKDIYAGELVCQGPNGPFTRFMNIGYKNDY